jgi:bZIP-type transcription factor MBZ1
MPLNQQMQQQPQIGGGYDPRAHYGFLHAGLNADGAFSYQQQVFSVLNMPETVIYTKVLSGKTSSFSPLTRDGERLELPPDDAAHTSDNKAEEQRSL